jgi:hypothetical protein
MRIERDGHPRGKVASPDIKAASFELVLIRHSADGSIIERRGAMSLP